MKRSYLILFMLFAATASAQQTEVGGFAGVGGFTADDVQNNTFWVAGAEACFLCAGKFAIFAEYNHYGNAGGKQGTHILQADLFSGGLRIQRPAGRVRPYFDVGISGGGDTSRSEYFPGNRSHGIIGMALGGGAAISISERWYIRPAVRTQLLGPGIHVGLSVSASIGYRF
jgi:hypothetical protein